MCVCIRTGRRVFFSYYIIYIPPEFVLLLRPPPPSTRQPDGDTVTRAWSNRRPRRPFGVRARRRFSSLNTTDCDGETASAIIDIENIIYIIYINTYTCIAIIDDSSSVSGVLRNAVTSGSVYTGINNTPATKRIRSTPKVSLPANYAARVLTSFRTALGIEKKKKLPLPPPWTDAGFWLGISSLRTG